MLEKALTGTSAVVTAGTGSGKDGVIPTTAFSLLGPRVGSVEQDRRSGCLTRTIGGQMSIGTTSAFRMRGSSRRIVKSLRVSQRSQETRDAAVRGLILYPMNALVEDQP